MSQFGGGGFSKGSFGGATPRGLGDAEGGPQKEPTGGLKAKKSGFLSSKKQIAQGLYPTAPPTATDQGRRPTSWVMS